jgi:serine/threonine protein kinase
VIRNETEVLNLKTRKTQVPLGYLTVIYNLQWYTSPISTFHFNECTGGNNTTKFKEPLSFDMRLEISLVSTRGILYLHTEANLMIFHRVIKASNMLLDSNYMAKVVDFGLSRLAPVPIEGVVPAHACINRCEGDSG